jgi:hypothetical protein
MESVNQGTNKDEVDKLVDQGVANYGFALEIVGLEPPTRISHSHDAETAPEEHKVDIKKPSKKHQRPGRNEDGSVRISSLSPRAASLIANKQVPDISPYKELKLKPKDK